MQSFLENESDTIAMSDEDVLRASLSDPEMFVYLVRKYEAPFLRKARTVLYREEDVEDVVQETFAKMYLHAKRFHEVDGATFKSWAYRILMNTAFTKYRTVMRHFGKTAELTPEHYEQLADDGYEETFHLELTDYVVSIFAKMPDHMVRVLRLHFIEGLAHVEIAERENTSEGAIKTRVHRAKAYFRELADQYSPY